MLASELFANAIGLKVFGNEQCHWCGGGCPRTWLHDGPNLRMPFVRNTEQARVPNACWCCVGCWSWRRRRVTVSFLGGGYKDNRTNKDYQWWITPEGALAVRKEDYKKLWEHLLNPPLVFSLMLWETGEPNTHLHLAVANKKELIRAETKLKFTVDNKEYEYSVYELEEALRHGDSGKDPGVRALIRILGKTELPELEKRGRGRPTNTGERPPLKKIIRE